MSDEVILKLDKNEAIVLFEFLKRFSEENSLKIENQSEERILWNLCGDLEKILVEPFQENYLEILSESRNNVRDKNE